MDGHHLPDITGLDVRLRDENGAVTPGLTGLAAALPTLVEDGELAFNPSDATDPYCVSVHDLTHW